MSKIDDHNTGLSPLMAVLLGLMVFLCLGLIGATGYVKFQLDHSETVLAAPVGDAVPDEAVAASRLAAQDSYKLWSLALTMTAWVGLMLAAILVAGLYLALRGRQSAPLRALAQSVENLSRGDMQTPIWGMERHDAVGELARAVDLARYHFSQLPDLSLMSDQGPVRLKFEGGARSLFQEMMARITGDYEGARAEIGGLTRTITTQQDLLTALSVRLNTAVAALQQHGAHSQKALHNLTEDLTASTRGLLDAQEKAAAHVEKLVPFMQERAHNMAEVTHIAGTKVTQTLQNLLTTEQNLRGSMANSQTVIANLAASANAMNERLFAAVNLMQASGKALGETTEATQGRLNAAIDAMTRGEATLQQIATRSEERLNTTAETEATMAALATRSESNAVRMENAINTMSERHEQLSEQVVLATHRMESIILSFDAAQKAMSEAMQSLRRDSGQIGGVLQDLRANNDKLIENLGASSLSSHDAVRNLTERGQSLLRQLEEQVAQQAQNTEARIAALATHGESLAQQAHTTTTALTQSVVTMRQEQEKFMETRQRFGDTVEQLGTRLEQQTAASLGKAEAAAEQGLGKLSAVADTVEAIAQRLAMLSQLTGTLGAVAGQLGQIVPTLGKGGGDTQPLLDTMQAQWRETLGEVAAMRDAMVALMLQQKDQLETRLAAFDQKLNAGGIDAQQMAIMGEIVAALAQINDHVMRQDEAAREA